MRRATRWIGVGAAAAAATAVIVGTPRTCVSRNARRTLVRLQRRVRFAEGRVRGAAYHLSGREPDPAVTDATLADRVRSRLGRTEQSLDLPHVHVMVEHHVALLHGAVGSEQDARRIEQTVASVPGVAGVESYLHVGFGRWDTRPSAGRAVHQPSRALASLLEAAEHAGITSEAAPLVVRGVLATFADRLPPTHRAHLSANLPADVRPLFTPPRRLRGAPPARSGRDLVGRVIATTSDLPLERAEAVTIDVVRALRDLVPGDVHEVASVLPPELRVLWERTAAA